MVSSRKFPVSPKASKRIAVALSGGLDSVVLLDMVCRAHEVSNKNNKQNNKHKNYSTEVWAFHVHHGLQKSADQWFEFCEKLVKKYNIYFDFRLLNLIQEKTQGNIEARAREGRYEALTDLCAEHGIEDLLLAHHQNDQAETVLLQLLRGAGVAGLSGMPEQRILHSEGWAATLHRPLLNQSRSELEAYAKEHQLTWIEDPSNQNTRFRRNAIRKQIIPRLVKMQPEALTNIARSAQLLAESQKLLDRLAIQDGKGTLQENTLILKALLILVSKDLPAANNLMRYWLKMNGLAMPSQERLESWWKDLNKVKVDASLEWIHDEASLRLWRGILQVATSTAGVWVFKAISSKSRELGLSEQFVREAQQQGQIFMRARKGSEKIQIKPNSPRKSLKNLFQEADVPPWERKAPLLYIGDELIAVAGVGVSYPHLLASGKRVQPQWVDKP